MKKFTLENIEAGKFELLSKTRLKKVLGGAVKLLSDPCEGQYSTITCSCGGQHHSYGCDENVINNLCTSTCDPYSHTCSC